MTRGEHTPGIVERLRDADALEYPIGTEDLCEEAADLISELLEALADTLALAALKWGNLDADANTVMDRARAVAAKARGGAS